MAGLAALVDRVLDHLTHPGEHQFAKVDPLEDFAALAVDDFALLVHDVVVLDEVTAGVEVVPLDLGLRALDLARHHARLDRLVVGDAQHVHHALDAVATEDAHQVVVERQKEARGTWVSLPARTAAELIVDAAALMPLGRSEEYT